MASTTSIQLVRMALAAAEAKLGMEMLARRLKAPETTVRAWRDGHSAMPQPKLVMLVDVMAEVDPHWKPD